MRIVIYLLFSIVAFNATSQQFADKEYYLVDKLVLEELSEADRKILESSLKMYHSAKNDTTRILSLGDICSEMNAVDWEKYEFFQYEELKLLMKNNPSKQELRAYKRYLSSTLNNIGYIYNTRGQIKKALNYLTRSLDLQEELRDDEGVANTLNNIGYIYGNQGQNEEALDYHLRSLKIREKLGNKEAIATSLVNIGVFHQSQGQYKDALSFFNRSLKLQEETGDQSGVGYSLTNIGTVYNDLGRPKEALHFLNRSLKIREELGDQSSIATTLSILGEIHKDQGRLKEALDCGLKSLAISKELGFPENIESASKLLSEIYEAEGDGMKALELHKLYILMRDSINNKEVQNATIKLQALHEFEKEQLIKENEAKEQARIETETIKRRDNLQYILILLGILALFGLILSLGIIKIPVKIAEGLIFLAFLILFEFLLVFLEPHIDSFTNGVPVYSLLFNAAIALLIFPFHSVMEKYLKRRLVKK